MSIAAGIIPDPWQARLLRSKADRILLNCSRQIGKSTTIGTLADHTAFYEDNSLILLLSPSQRQSSELFMKCLAVYRALGRPVPSTTENKLSLELANGSRMVALPGSEDTILGMSGVDVLIIDEASHVDDELYYSVLPMVAVSHGRIILLSNPNNTQGFFYEEYLKRKDWDYYEVPATECPRISPEFLADMREKMGKAWYEKSFCCKFNDAAGSAFRSEDIERIVDGNITTWML